MEMKFVILRLKGEFGYFSSDALSNSTLSAITSIIEHAQKGKSLHHLLIVKGKFYGIKVNHTLNHTLNGFKV